MAKSIFLEPDFVFIISARFIKFLLNNSIILSSRVSTDKFRLLDKSFMIRVYSSVFTGKNGIKSFIPVNSPFSAAFLFCNSKFSKVLFCGFDNS